MSISRHNNSLIISDCHWSIVNLSISIIKIQKQCKLVTDINTIWYQSFNVIYIEAKYMKDCQIEDNVCC